MKYPVRVIVKDIITKEIIHDKIGDHDDHQFRVWMGKTAYWAMRNDHSITCYPLDEGNL